MKGIACLLLLLFPIVAIAREPLPPRDEASRQPGFFSFRAQLAETIANRDTEALLAVVSPHVGTSFGGSGGIEEFRRTWALDSASSPFWREMAVVLALGGSFQGANRFVAPYTFSEWPDDRDAFTHVAVIGENVNIRDAPGFDSRVIATASFEILRSLEPGGTGSWTRVRLDDGRTGYISNRYVRSPIDYRAIFEKEYGRWWLTVFIAGD